MKLDYMEIAISAFLGEIAQRSISFFINKLEFSREDSTSLPFNEHLRRKLLRVRIIVEEAEGRQIRNQAMLEQLKLLQAGMYRGYYVLDTYRYQAHHEEDHSRVSHSFAISKFNPTKRVMLRKGRSGRGGQKEMHQVIGSLEIIIRDASELVMFLNGSPPLYRQLYSAYLIMEKCMFGRHVEMEQIINFLMQKGSQYGTINLDVLPIVGPAKVGKSTLIEHVCSDERVHTAFSRIMFFTEEDLSAIKHQNHVSNRDERVLVIVEVNEDINEAVWSTIYSSSKRYAANGGKIIICSRSDNIARFGTTRALKVEYLSREAYWYFFKGLAFGSVDPEEEPELVAIAMEITVGLHGSFIAGNVIARVLRANFSVKFWRMALSCLKEASCFTHGSRDYQIVSADNQAPMITFQDVWSGGAIPQGTFDVLAWRSTIPPYYSFSISCEIH
ncbi:hypothetical protein ACP4OV_028130 [Aristida adscensionis]